MRYVFLHTLSITHTSAASSSHRKGQSAIKGAERDQEMAVQNMFFGAVIMVLFFPFSLHMNFWAHALKFGSMMFLNS